MRSEVISEARNALGQLEVESLWLLTDAEVSQFQRTGLAPHVALGENVLTQVHHILSPSRASERGQRIITRPADGALLHASGVWVPVEDLLSEAFTPWEYVVSGHDVPVWTRVGGLGDTPAFGFVPTKHFAPRGQEPEYLDPQWQRETFVRNPADEIAVIRDWKGALLDGQLTRSEPIDTVQRTTLNLQVGSGPDDTNRSSTFSNGNVWLAVGDVTGTAWKISSLFTGATMPQGATINTASMVYTAYTTLSSVVVNTNLAFEDADSATAPTTGAEFDTLVSGQTTPVAWDGLSSWTQDVEYTSADTASSLQEVVDRVGYGESSVQNLHTNDGSSNSAYRQARSYNGSTSLAPKLDIDYTAGGAANPKGVLGLPLHGPLRRVVGP